MQNCTGLYELRNLDGIHSYFRMHEMESSLEDSKCLFDFHSSFAQSPIEGLLVLCTEVGVGCHYKRLTAIFTITNQEAIFLVLYLFI